MTDAEPWKWPTDADLAGLTLREKRRQHQIMANECRNRAGPMGADGKHKRPQWIERAILHQQEAAKLTTIILSFVGRDRDAA